ncbi:MAG: hypothetical protein Q9220_001283 [cf. Caloplaca sp. 1 TL-2023]
MSLTSVESPSHMDAMLSIEPDSESDGIIHRSRKRRRLDKKAFSETNGNDNVTSDDADKLSIHKPSIRDKENTDPDTPKAKRSKYRIHIPNNATMPEDAFFTQPPLRSPSPYRIDKFCWQKPRRPPMSNVPGDNEIQSFRAIESRHEQLLPARSNTRPVETSEQTVYQSQEIFSSVLAETIEPNPSFDDTTGAQQDISYSDDDHEHMLADLPSDAFSSPASPSRRHWGDSIEISSQDPDTTLAPSQNFRSQNAVAPLTNLRQTTLFGEKAPQVSTSTQSTRRPKWPEVKKSEAPTHHKINREAMTTWVYPTNLGKIRDYQYSIVSGALYHNTLVALPTGLGKTFIAATIMLNWFRWTADAQVVFVAPTKPLVAQQVKACFEIAGIPKSATTMLTGNTPPGIRAEEWSSKRVFFMTPQTIINDLKTGICDPKRLVLLIVDEAHRATGGYAYVEVVQFLRRFNTSFRVLALTATPGSSIESVQEVIDGLGISRIEIRTEESIDIRDYVHSRKIETVLFEYNAEITMIMDLFAKAIQPVLDKLCGLNAYWGRDPMTLTAYGCTQARSRWMSSDAGRNASWAVKGPVNQMFSILAGLGHAIELLKFHGIGPFYHKILAFQSGQDGAKGSKTKAQIAESEPFRKMMSRMQIWINNPDFVGHPKLEYLQRVVLNHFLDAGEGRGAAAPSNTRIMVFAHYRDSAEEIARLLSRNEPMIRPHVFVGQAHSKGSEGMDQKRQLEVIRKFQNGVYNTLIATSIGEEGLDIGEIDLIVCYDASASPIRMLQRMGRTGRKRAGNIVVTLMKGKEEDNFTKAKDNYEKMQREIASGQRFAFHDEQPNRIVPREIQPVVDKRVVEIPVENTQADLPEPSKRAKAPKRPPKKFHMPGGVRKGFVKASSLADSDAENDSIAEDASQPEPRLESPEPLPTLAEVLLSSTEQRELERTYQDVKGDSPSIVELPRMDTFPMLQRVPRPSRHVPHGRMSRRTTKMLDAMHSFADGGGKKFEAFLHPDDLQECLTQSEKRAAFFAAASKAPDHTHASKPATTGTQRFPPHPDQSSIDPSVPCHALGERRESSSQTSNLSQATDTLPCPRLAPGSPGAGTASHHNNHHTDEVSSVSSEGDLPDISTLVEKTSRSIFGGRDRKDHGHGSIVYGSAQEKEGSGRA